MLTTVSSKQSKKFEVVTPNYSDINTDQLSFRKKCSSSCIRKSIKFFKNLLEPEIVFTGCLPAIWA